MTRPLGKLQLERLMGLSSPSSLMVVGDSVSASLVKRGLLKPYFSDNPDAWHRITPAGMRVLADAFETGQLDQFMKKFPISSSQRDGIDIADASQSYQNPTK